MKLRTKIILALAAFITPFIVLKLMGRPIIVETKLTLKADKQSANCIPLTISSIIDTPLVIEHPSMGFAASNRGMLRQMGRLDMTFADIPDGQIILPGKANRKTCLNFRSQDRVHAVRKKLKLQSEEFLFQCKLGVMVGSPDAPLRRVYALVFPCDRYLKGFDRPAGLTAAPANQ